MFSKYIIPTQRIIGGKKIAEMPCTPPESHSADIRLEGAQDRVTVILEDNFCEKDEYSASYFTNDEMTYEFAVEGFEGNLSSYQIFEIKDSSEEQFYRLYPIADGRWNYIYGVEFG